MCQHPQEPPDDAASVPSPHADVTAGAAQRPLPEIVRVLVDNHHEFLRFLERRVGNRALAEDILQDAFARGIDRIGTLRSDESAVAWFYRSLRNAIVDQRRRHQSAANALAAFSRELEGAEQGGPELTEAICQCVTRLASTLKPEYADALKAIDVSGLSVKDFAQERGLSSNNAAVRAFRARKALRRQVVASCGTCAEHGCYACSCSAPETVGGTEGHGCKAKEPS